MQSLKSFLLALSTVMLVTVSMRGYAQGADCRSCHTSNGAAGARDFSYIYATPSSHHPVGTEYPAGLNTKPNFKQPNGQSAVITFFDRNGNGQPDNDEIQMFSANGAATVECASCHMEHGKDTAPANAVSNFYLRVDNAGSALCTTCHNY